MRTPTISIAFLPNSKEIDAAGFDDVAPFGNAVKYFETAKTEVSRFGDV